MRVGFVGTGGRSNAHLKVVLQMQQEKKGVEAAAVCDVYNVNLKKAAERIQKAVGTDPKQTGDDIVDSEKRLAICVRLRKNGHAGEWKDDTATADVTPRRCRQGCG